MRKSNKFFLTIACMACVTIIGAAGVYGYFSGKKNTAERNLVARVLIDENIPDDKGLVQWKYEDEPEDAWRDVEPVRVLTNGKDVDVNIVVDNKGSDTEFRTRDGYIEYREKLVALNTLDGANGDISEEIG